MAACPAARICSAVIGSTVRPAPRPPLRCRVRSANVRPGRFANRNAYAILVMTHGPGTLTGRTPVTVKVLPSGLVTLNVFALTCRTTEPEP